MATLEVLRRQVDATENLQSVVRTMKALAAVRIRQFEEAAEALHGYRRTVELGLRVVLRQTRGRNPRQGAAGAAAALIVIGSDQGMCGQFNEDAAEHARKVLAPDESESGWRILAVGEKVKAALAAEKQEVTRSIDVPSSAEAIAADARDILAVVQEWQAEAGPLREVTLVHNRYQERDIFPRDRRLLPMDEQWLEQMREQPWPTHKLPMMKSDADAMLSHLVRQYLFVELHGALAESLAAENATRLRAMQSAEKNVEERLDELTTRYNRQRQNSITAELLDVISGSEAVAE